MELFNGWFEFWRTNRGIEHEQTFPWNLGCSTCWGTLLLLQWYGYSIVLHCMQPQRSDCQRALVRGPTGSNLCYEALKALALPLHRRRGCLAVRVLFVPATCCADFKHVRLLSSVTQVRITQVLKNENGRAVPFFFDDILLFRPLFFPYPSMSRFFLSNSIVKVFFRTWLVLHP